MEPVAPNPLDQAHPSVTAGSGDQFRVGKSSPVLVVGASARAAACSAVLAGREVHAIDLFGDDDLRALAKSVAVVDSLAWNDCRDAIDRLIPHGELAPPWECLPTGGMEHHPETLIQLARRTRWLGSDPTLVGQLRSPWQLAQWTCRSGLDAPKLLAGECFPDHPCQWLRKDTNRSGGLGIVSGKRWSDGHRREASKNSQGESAGFESRGTHAHHWQRRVSGYDASVVGIAVHDQVEWLGATRQWSGMKGFGARPYYYSGSFGPISLHAETWKRLTLLAQFAMKEGGLQGPFGIDLRLDGRKCWVLEINPRYPAGAEVLERAHGVSVLERWQDLHRGQIARPFRPVASVRPWAKGIRYKVSKGSQQVTAVGRARMLGFARRFGVEIADLPSVGSCLSEGAPIFTLLAPFPSPRGAVVGFVRVGNLCETLVFAPI